MTAITPSDSCPYPLDELRRIDALALALRYHEGPARSPLWAKPASDDPDRALTVEQLLADADAIRRWVEDGER